MTGISADKMDEMIDSMNELNKNFGENKKDVALLEFL